MQCGAKEEKCRGNIFDEGGPNGAQHGNVAVHSHSQGQRYYSYLLPDQGFEMCFEI